jgi:hypothetical protein
LQGQVVRRIARYVPDLHLSGIRGLFFLLPADCYFFLSAGFVRSCRTSLLLSDYFFFFLAAFLAFFFVAIAIS